MEWEMNPYGNGTRSNSQKETMISLNREHPYFKYGSPYFISAYKNMHTGSVIVHHLEGSVKKQNKSLTLYEDEQAFHDSWKEIKIK